MRTTSVLVALVCCLTGCGHATQTSSFISTGDGGWEFVKPTPCVQNWCAVHFLDDKTGWVAGGDCAILKTTDGGQHWAPQGPRVRKILKDIFFIDRYYGWAVGQGIGGVDETGIIEKTTDGGATWRVVLNGKIEGLRAVSFVSEKVGWAVGAGPPGYKGVVLKTTDGGETWLKQDCGISVEEKDFRIFHDVTFFDQDTGYILCDVNANGILLKTTDGGASWSRFGEIRKAESFQFLNPDTGWVLAGAEILGTTDGGRTWSKADLRKLFPPNKQFPVTNHPESFHFSDANNGIAISYGGDAVRTKDGGKTWTRATTGLKDVVSQPRVHMADAKNGWAVGYSGQMMRTSDGGATWQSLSCGRDDFTGSVTFAGSTAWASGSVENSRGPAGVFLKSEDGGITWTRQAIDRPYQIGDVCFVGKTGWAAGIDGIVAKTTDGGATWQARQTPVKTRLSCPYFVDDLNGWVVGAEGSIVRTSDGGKTWTKLESGTMDHLGGVYFSDKRTGLVCGQGGRIMKTTDGGATWIRKGTGTIDFLADMCFLDARTGWACGTRGCVLKTMDGGETWTRQTTGRKEELAGICFIDQSEGWAAGLGTTMVHTTDGGQTWTTQDYGTWNGLWDVRFSDSDNGIAVGGPIILRTTTGGLPGAVWAKKQPNGKQADFGHLVITKKSQGYLLAEHPESRVGIHIKTSDDKPAVGDYIYVHGKIATENGEKIIAADSIDIQCAGWGILPAR